MLAPVLEGEPRKPHAASPQRSRHAPLPERAAFPKSVIIGFENQRREQVVGLICVQDKVSHQWRSMFAEGPRANPGGILTAEVMEPDDYLGWDAIACRESTSCPATAELAGLCADLMHNDSATSPVAGCEGLGGSVRRGRGR